MIKFILIIWSILLIWTYSYKKNRNRFIKNLNLIKY